jgi:hypothetical protein
MNLDPWLLGPMLGLASLTFFVLAFGAFALTQPENPVGFYFLFVGVVCLFWAAFAPGWVS